MIHSSCYRLSQNILQRAEQGYVLVEITALNYVALIEEDNICFADLSKIEKHKDLQGSPVTICWKPHLPESMENLGQHIPMKVTFYADNLEQTQSQLTVEFYRALMLTNEMHKDEAIPSSQARIIPLDN